MSFKAGQIFEKQERWIQLLNENNAEGYSHTAWLMKIVREGAVDCLSDEFLDEKLFDKSITFNNKTYNGWVELRDTAVQHYSDALENDEIVSGLINKKVTTGAFSKVTDPTEIDKLVLNSLNLVGLDGPRQKPRILIHPKINACSKKGSTKLDGLTDIMSTLDD